MKNLDAFFAWAEAQQNLEHSIPLRPRKAYRSPLFSPRRMEVLSECVGNPHRAYNIVHIAGSKGKGSTAHLLARSLAAHGQQVGCYLSPHVFDYRERFLLFPHDLLKEEMWLTVGKELRTTLYSYCGDISNPKPHPVLGTVSPTTFEILTLFAFLLFRAAGCQWAMIECGLGGLHDSTNVVVPAVTAITSIEREHTQYLGWRFASIAKQKAGIIKPGVPLFLFPQRVKLVTRVLQRRAAALNAPTHTTPPLCPPLLVQNGERGQNAVIETQNEDAKEQDADAVKAMEAIQNTMYRLPSIQQTNISAAYAISRHIIPRFSPWKFHDLLTAKMQLPARYQQLATEPAPLYCDGAHTVHSLTAAVNSFVASYGTEGVCIFGCSADKNGWRLLRTLRGSFNHYIFTASGSESLHKMTPPIQLVRRARWLCFPRDSYRIIEDAADVAAEITTRRLPTLICGSFYVIAPLMKTLGFHNYKRTATPL